MFRDLPFFRRSRSGQIVRLASASADKQQRQLLTAHRRVQATLEALLAQNAKALKLIEEMQADWRHRSDELATSKLIAPATQPTAIQKMPKRARAPSANQNLLTCEQVCDMFGGITRAGLYKGMKDGRFPRPIKISPKIARWLRSECDDVIRRKAEERT